MRRSGLLELVDDVLSSALDPQAVNLIRHALAWGASPLNILRGIFGLVRERELRWLIVEALMAKWCREELRNMRAAGSDGSAEWVRVSQWLRELTQDIPVTLPTVAGLESPPPVVTPDNGG